MSENKRSFWASVPGLVTGLAGLLTGVVGLITLLVQLNVIGGDGSSSPTTSPTQVAGTPTTGGGGATPATGVSATFSVDPSLDFPPADPKEKVVTVRNTSSTAPITVLPPAVDGENGAAFTASVGTCGNGPVMPKLSCTIKVTFTPPPGVLRRYNATLQVRAQGAPAGAEVKLTGSTIL